MPDLIQAFLDVLKEHGPWAALVSVMAIGAFFQRKDYRADLATERTRNAEMVDQLASSSEAIDGLSQAIQTQTVVLQERLSK